MQIRIANVREALPKISITAGASAGSSERGEKRGRSRRCIDGESWQEYAHRCCVSDGSRRIFAFILPTARW